MCHGPPLFPAPHKRTPGVLPGQLKKPREAGMGGIMPRVVGSLGAYPHFCDTRIISPLYGGLVFGKPCSLHHRSGFHFPQPSNLPVHDEVVELP